jgi:AAA15 family ATPase/GTPase
MAKYPLSTRPLLLKGIGFQNFKSFRDYTYVPIEQFSMFIGPNGSGKSSCWQVLDLLKTCLKLKPSLEDYDYNENLLEMKFSLHEFAELGQSTEAFLYNQSEPLIIELTSSLKINSNGFLSNNDIKYIFNLEHSRSKDESFFRITSYSINDSYNNTLMYFENKAALKSDDDYFTQPYRKVESEDHSNNLGNYILDVCKELHEHELQSQELTNTLERFINQFNDSSQWSDLKYYLVFSKGGDGSKYFDEFLRGRYDIIHETDWQLRTAADSLQSLIDSSKSREPFLPYIVDFVFERIKVTFQDTIKAINNIFILKRKHIGFPEIIVPKETDSGIFLSILKPKPDSFMHNEPLFNPEDSLQVMTGGSEQHSNPEKPNKESIFQCLGFEGIPEIREHKKGGKMHYFTIQVNGKDFPLVGMGFWSLTFIVNALIYAFENKSALLIIEEPETNLHPNLQVELMDVLIECSQKSQIPIVIETHSEYMMRRLQLRVHEGSRADLKKDIVSEVKHMLGYNNFRSVQIANDQVCINSFEQKLSAPDVYCCKTITINKNGSLQGELPYTFSSIAANDAMLLNIWINKSLNN